MYISVDRAKQEVKLYPSDHLNQMGPTLENFEQEGKMLLSYISLAREIVGFANTEWRR